MKRKMIPVLLLSLLLCSCGNNLEETADITDNGSQQRENTTENIQKSDTEDNVAYLETEENQKTEEDAQQVEYEEAEKSDISVNQENNSKVQEDKSAIGREEWIERALQEEEARRIMPELAGAEAIISYIAKTGGKAYKGTYEGNTYWMYLTADCNYAGQYTPYVTVVKEMDTSKNPEAFAGMENRYGIIEDDTEIFLDARTRYKFGYNGSDFDRTIGDFIESDGYDGQRGISLFFNSGTDVIYTFREDNPEWQSGDSHDPSIEKEIQFTLTEPESAKYWYSQYALNGDWNDFMVYDGYYGNYYVRVEFTDGQNMMATNRRYYMTVLSSVEDLDTFNEKKYHIMTHHYSYSEFSKLEDEEFMLEFISERQAVLTNKQTGTSALVKYHKGYFTEVEPMNDSPYYFYDKRIVDSNAYGLEGKDYTAPDGTVISFSAGGGSWVNYEDTKDVGERIVNIYQGGNSVLTAQAQVIDGITLQVVEASTNTDLLFIWSDDNHFVVQGTGEYLPNLDGMSFSYEENQLYGY